MARSALGNRGAAARATVLVACVGVMLLLGACTGPVRSPQPNAIAPLQLEHRTLYPDEVAQRVETPDLLALDDEMRDFVRRYTADLPGDRQRVHMLHRAVKSSGTLGMEYDPFAEGTAEEAFHRGSANCLSFASLFVALAREASLDAHFQWLEVRPQWTRMGERVAVRLHVNALVDTARGERYQVDIDPLQSGDVAGARQLSDRDAEALYHNNIAMGALAEEDLEQAWLQLVAALNRSPRMSHLWVNLGIVYRQAGQLQDAERSYMQALALDSRDRSAMTNLMVLYEIQGRQEERAIWEDKVRRYRDRNPYFHAWLGERAAEEDDWSQALRHFERAISLSPQESHLLYTAGVVHYELGNLPAAQDYINRAIEVAPLLTQREDYRVKLEAISRGRQGGS